MGTSPSVAHTQQHKQTTETTTQTTHSISVIPRLVWQGLLCGIAYIAWWTESALSDAGALSDDGSGWSPFLLQCNMFITPLWLIQCVPLHTMVPAGVCCGFMLAF